MECHHTDAIREGESNGHRQASVRRFSCGSGRCASHRTARAQAHHYVPCFSTVSSRHSGSRPWSVSARSIQARGWSVLEAVSNMDDNRQYEQVQSMIQRKVDGIVIIQTDQKAVIPAIRAANAAGIPMVHFNRPPAPSDAYSVAVVVDNRKLMDGDTVTALLDVARKQGGPLQGRCVTR